MLTALRDTGQSDGNLYDVVKISTVTGISQDLVNPLINTLHQKGYLPPAGISEQARETARQQLAEFVAFLNEGHARGNFAWGDLGVPRMSIYRLRHGRLMRPKGIRRIGEALALPPSQVEAYERAGALLIRDAVSRGLRRGQSASTPPVLCSICHVEWVAVTSGRDDKHPVCQKCATRRSHALWRRGRLPPTPGGEWLYTTLCTLYAGPTTFNGALSAAARDTGVAQETLSKWCWAPPPFPREETLDRLVPRLARRQRELRLTDPPITRELIMQAFGWIRTWEQEQQARRPRCADCGTAVALRGTICSSCASLKRILSHGLPTEGAKYVYTVMALSCGVPPARIAEQLNLQAGVVDEWASRPKVRELAQAIRDARARIHALLTATAGVLHVGVNTLERRLHRLYPLGGRRRRRAQRFTKRVDVAATLGLAQEEFLRMFRFEGTVRDLARRRARHRQKNAKPPWQPQKKPRTACPVCGANAPRSGRPYCSELHSNLHRIVRSMRVVIRSARNNEISQRFFLMIAMSCGLSVGQAAGHLAIPEEQAASWVTDAFRATVARIRNARGRRSDVIGPVAGVFEWSVGTVERYLYHRIFRPGRKRSSIPRRFRWSHVQSLADRLDIAPKECLALLRAVGTWEDHVRTMFRKSRMKLHRIRTRTLGQRGRAPSQCHSVRAAVALGKRLDRIPSTREMARADIEFPRGQSPRAFLVRHGRRCRDCRTLVAAFLHRCLGESERQIGRTLKIPRSTARRAIAAGLARLSHPVKRKTRGPQMRTIPLSIKAF